MEYLERELTKHQLELKSLREDLLALIKLETYTPPLTEQEIKLAHTHNVPNQ